MEWVEVSPNSDCFVLEYQAKGYARTNCFAFRDGEGFVILSPASNISERQIKFIEDRGPILALLPPHPGHTLGIRDWLQLRPTLKVYAAPGAIARIRKVCDVEVSSLDEIPTSDKSVEISLAPGMAESTVFVKVSRNQIYIVYVDELLEDLDRYPGPRLLRPLMSLLGKRSGFQVNRGIIRFFVKDLAALKAEVIRLTSLPNAHVIFAHGPVRSTDIQRAQALHLLNGIATK